MASKEERLSSDGSTLSFEAFYETERDRLYGALCLPAGDSVPVSKATLLSIDRHLSPADRLDFARRRRRR